MKLFKNKIYNDPRAQSYKWILQYYSTCITEEVWDHPRVMLWIRLNDQVFVPTKDSLHNKKHGIMDINSE